MRVFVQRQAKDVLYGLYADTAVRGQPQVACQNEDGTTNMECMDNHTAGTPPSWGAPLHTISSIFARDRDEEWLRGMHVLSLRRAAALLLERAPVWRTRTLASSTCAPRLPSVACRLLRRRVPCPARPTPAHR